MPLDDDIAAIGAWIDAIEPHLPTPVDYLLRRFPGEHLELLVAAVQQTMPGQNPYFERILDQVTYVQYDTGKIEKTRLGKVIEHHWWVLQTGAPGTYRIGIDGSGGKWTGINITYGGM